MKKRGQINGCQQERGKTRLLLWLNLSAIKGEEAIRDKLYWLCCNLCMSAPDQGCVWSNWVKGSTAFKYAVCIHSVQKHNLCDWSCKETWYSVMIKNMLPRKLVSHLCDAVDSMGGEHECITEQLIKCTELRWLCWMVLFQYMSLVRFSQQKQQLRRLDANEYTTCSTFYVF